LKVSTSFGSIVRDVGFKQATFDIRPGGLALSAQAYEGRCKIPTNKPTKRDFKGSDFFSRRRPITVAPHS